MGYANAKNYDFVAPDSWLAGTCQKYSLGAFSLPSAWAVIGLDLPKVNLIHKLKSGF